jgi:hypothetical protein
MGIAAAGMATPIGDTQVIEVLTMSELRDICDRPTIYSRAEPDDEYDPRPEPLDPYLIDPDDDEIDDEEVLDVDEDED